MSRFYKQIVCPVLDRLDSETMHHAAIDILHLAQSTALTRTLVQAIAGGRITSPKLRTTVGGLTLENPLMVAAGWDKAARAVRALSLLGFAAVEIGTVPELAQPGNPKPRQWMIGDGVAINWLGFNSPGMEVVARNLESYRDLGIPIGLNLGKNKDVTDKDAAAAYARVAARLARFADYVVINVSSPNTPGLRKLQEKELLTDIVQAVRAALQTSPKPAFVKIAPDLTNEAVDDVISVVLENNLTGIVATNTTISADIKAKYGERWKNQSGGLSGNDADYRRMSTEKIAHIYRETRGKLDIIGVGGVHDAETALEKILAGASAVQVLTAIRGVGPRVANSINAGLLKLLEQEKVNSLHDLVGRGVK